LEDVVVEVNIILKWTLKERLVETRENVYDVILVNEP